jgi:SAM-dependent methyltransferase
VVELAGRAGAELASPIADLACGPGRHSRELARRGERVIGIDLSAPFLGMAQVAADGGSPQRFVCGDLRRLAIADASFRTALLLGNSFGYFSDDENLAILAEIARILQPGGLLCLEVTARDAYLAAMRPYEEELVRGRRYPRLRCQWWKRWDAATGRVHTLERHSLPATGELVYEGPYDVRLYGWRELRRAIVGAGFRDLVRSRFAPATETLAGGLGETFGAMSEVLFVAARG